MIPKKRSSSIKRKFVIYSCLVLVTMVAGLLSRSEVVQLPSFASAYAADTLWALMVFWLICIVAPNTNIGFKLLAAIIFAFGIEFSQLYHAPWIDEIRSNKLGGLILGYGFKSSDLLCYSVGVFFGALVDFTILRKIFANLGITK